MQNPLCKYCGNPMSIQDIDYYGISYECHCDGYIKEQELEEEISAIEDNLRKKKAELECHRANSLYRCSIRELEQKIKEIESQYRD